MLKNATYKDKFVMLGPWMSQILESIKKDLKQEHLKRDWQFCKLYLPGKSINKLTMEDLVEAYTAAVQKGENGEAVAEFISNRWLLKHGELYSYFEAKLSEIHPNFTELETIDLQKAQKLAMDAASQFGALKTYLFSVINSVVFPEEVYKALNKQAQQDAEAKNAEEEIEINKSSVEALGRSYELKIARLTDKYEKKLAGLQKKYIQDTENLKKQLSILQKKVAGH